MTGRSSSHKQSHPRGSSASLANAGELFTPDQLTAPAPGSLNDEFLIRGIVTSVIRNSSKSRDQIAEEMTNLLGAEVTRRALDSYTSESAKQNRWPAQYTRAFCHVTGDYQLFHCVVERAGLHVISSSEHQLMELGRQIITADRAQAEILRLKTSLEKVAL